MKLAGMEKTAAGWDELLTKEPDLLSRLVFDWYRHASFLDHVFAADTTLEGVSKACVWRTGRFCESAVPEHGRRLKGSRCALVFEREGGSLAEWGPSCAVHHEDIPDQIRLTAR